MEDKFEELRGGEQDKLISVLVNSVFQKQNSTLMGILWHIENTENTVSRTGERTRQFPVLH